MTIETHRASVEQNRKVIAQQTAARDAAASAPVDLATAAARIDVEITAAQARFDGFRHLSSPGGGWDAERFNRTAGQDLFGFLAAYDPKGLKETALATVPAGGLSEAARAAAIASASGVLAEAEIAEEITLRQLDALIGGHEPRRPDARPEIMLAPLAELEAAAKPKPAGFFKKAS